MKKKYYTHDEIFSHYTKILNIIYQTKSRVERIQLLKKNGYNVHENGYMRDASKIGQIEYFPTLQEVRISVSRVSYHFSRQFDYISFKTDKPFLNKKDIRL